MRSSKALMRVLWIYNRSALDAFTMINMIFVEKHFCIGNLS